MGLIRKYWHKEPARNKEIISLLVKNIFAPLKAASKEIDNTARQIIYTTYIF